MTTNLRISLTILSIGFAVEGGGEIYSLNTSGAFLPGTSLFFLLPAVMTFLGLLFLLIGRHEWSEVHRVRVRHSNQIFGLSVLSGIIATVELVLLAAYPTIGSPPWAEVLFGTATGSLILGTFVTYAYLVFHLVSRPSKVALVASALWALIVCAVIGSVLGADLPTILALIGSHSLSVDALVVPVDYFLSYLFISYFLLLAAYVDAHVAVARGPPSANIRKKGAIPARHGTSNRPRRSGASSRGAPKPSSGRGSTPP